jgi:hypothetical protein
MLLQLSKAELNRLVFRAMRSGEEAADVCDLLARMLVIGPKLDADPNYQPEDFEGGGLVEIAAGAAAIAGLKIVAAAHNLSFTEAALYLKNEWVRAKSLAADFFRGHGGHRRLLIHRELRPISPSGQATHIVCRSSPKRRCHD